MQSWVENNWFKILAIIILIGALGEWPYSYYQLLRWVVATAGAYSAYLSYYSKKTSWMWIFIAIAIIFNPFAPFYLQKNTWQAIDLLTAIIFIVSLLRRTN